MTDVRRQLKSRRLHDSSRDVGPSGPAPWSYKWGFVVCMLYGIVLGACAAVIGLIRYAFAAMFLEFDGFIFGEVAIYVLGFVSAGVVAGLLNPLARGFVGAAAVGTLALVPVGFSWVYIENGGFLSASPDDFVVTVAVVIIFGIVVGLSAWDALVKPRGGTAPWADR